MYRPQIPSAVPALQDKTGRHERAQGRLDPECRDVRLQNADDIVGTGRNTERRQPLRHPLFFGGKSLNKQMDQTLMHLARRHG